MSKIFSKKIILVISFVGLFFVSSVAYASYDREFWFKFGTVPANGTNLVCIQNAGGTPNACLQIQSGKLNWWVHIGGDNNILASGAPSTGVWYDVLLSNTSGTYTMYIDGVSVGNISATSYDISTWEEYAYFCDSPGGDWLCSLTGPSSGGTTSTSTESEVNGHYIVVLSVIGLFLLGMDFIRRTYPK